MQGDVGPAAARAEPDAARSRRATTDLELAEKARALLHIAGRPGAATLAH